MTESELLALINANLPDNNDQEISALKLRQVLSNLLSASYLPSSESLSLIYNSDIVYKVNDICMFGGLLYLCTAPTTGVFNAAAWLQIGTNNNLFSLLSDAPAGGYFGNRGKLIGVNSAETGLEFVDGLNNASLYSFENDFVVGQGLPTIFNSLALAQYVTEGGISPTNGLGVYRLQANAANAVAQLGYFQAGGVPITPFIRNIINEHKQLVHFSINQNWSFTNQARIMFAFAGTAGFIYQNGFSVLPNASTLIMIEPDTASGNTSHYTISLVQRNISQTRITASFPILAGTAYSLQLNWSPAGCQAFVNGQDWFGGLIANNNSTNVQCGVIFGLSRINTSTVSGNFIVDIDKIAAKGSLNSRTLNFI